MPRKTDEGPVVTPKLLITAVAVLAIAIGFALPGPHGPGVKAKEQIPTMEVGQS